MGFNCLNVQEPLQGGNLLFTTKSPGGPGTHLIDLASLRVAERPKTQDLKKLGNIGKISKLHKIVFL